MENSKHILLLNKADKASVKKVENQLSTSIVSSAELSSKVRAKDIIDNGKALHLKNLGVIITKSEEDEKLKHLSDKANSSVVYYEKSKMIFRPVAELSILDKIRESSEEMLQYVQELEDLIKAKQVDHNERLTWGLNALGINQTKLTGLGVDVCILDSGFYKDHPDFANRKITGKSFVPNQPWDEDKKGHGTHCTGTALGYKSSENGIRYGIAYEANIAIGKVLNDDGIGATDWILDALDNCIEKKYKVISMSLGASVRIGEKPNPIFERVGQIAMQNNCLLIAAAGNESDRPSLPRPVNMPGNCESFMAVAALQNSLRVAGFSNAGINVRDGGKVDVAAPGGGVYSCYSPNAIQNELYHTMNGTSMATPHVSGLAAMYCEAFPHLSAAQIWMKLEKKCKQLNNQKIRDVGNGLVQVI